MSDDFLLPLVDVDSAPFWEACTAGELRIQACEQCGRRRMPPRPMCPWCRATSSQWDLMSGRGRVWSFVVPHPPLLPAYSAVAPYNVAVIELADDPSIRLVGNIATSPDAPWDSVDPAAIEIGSEVQACFPEPRDGIVLPRWKLV